MECLDPHLQTNKNKQFLLQSRRNIYTVGQHDTSLYLLFRNPLISVIIPKVREPQPDMRLLQGHQHFGVAIFHFRITHHSKKCHTVCLIVTDSVFGVDQPPEPCLKSVEHTQICWGITRIHRSPSRPRPSMRPTAAFINIHEHLI